MSKSNGFYHLTEARELRGFSVTELAEKIGVSRQVIYKYENGLQVPSAPVQQSIIQELDFPYSFFEFSESKADIMSRPIFFRDMKTNLQKNRSMASRWLQLLCSHVEYLQEYLELNEVNCPDFDIQDIFHLADTEIDVFAEKLRRFWGLGNGPISNLTQLLENNGFIIFRKLLQADKMDACSLVKDGRPYILINTYKKTCSRDLMNLAHELGHVVLHQGVSIEDLHKKETFELVEHQAWRFAEAFLMPPSVFIPEVGYPTLSQFKSLKLRWRTSIAAMVKYCRDFEVFDKAKAQYFFREMARQKMNKEEPYDTEMEIEKSSILFECANILSDEGIKTHMEMLDDSGLNEEDYCELIAAPDGFFSVKKNRPRLKLLPTV